MILVGSLVLMVGAVPLDWTQLLAGDSQGQTILWQLRLPRVLLAGLVAVSYTHLTLPTILLV